MKLKSFLLWSGCVGFIILASAGIGSLLSPRIADGLLWRFEKIERSKSISQRIYEIQMERSFLWAEETLPKGIPLMFGDSHLQLLPKDQTGWVANFAVGGQPVHRMIDRLPKFQTLQTASAVILNGGENDLVANLDVSAIADSWSALLSRLPKTKKTICVGIPETSGPRRDAQRVKELNLRIASICRAQGAIFVDVTMGKGEFIGHALAADQVHLDRPSMYTLARLLQRLSLSN